MLRGTGEEDDDVLEIDDDVIADPNFAILLNENREIVVLQKVLRCKLQDFIKTQLL